jgi:hypothetical protein
VAAAVYWSLRCSRAKPEWVEKQVATATKVNKAARATAEGLTRRRAIYRAGKVNRYMAIRKRLV